MSVVYFENKYYPKIRSGSDFSEERSFLHERGVALEGEGGFFASGLNEGGLAHFIGNPSVTLKEWVTGSFGDTAPVESSYVPGTCYKRIWRPLVCVGTLSKTISQEKLYDSFVSLRMLLNKLEDLFETLEPSEANLSAYGHKIREILLLACMEVESSWSAVLKENGYSPAGRLTTNDYVKLLEPMLLDGYELSLQSYPHFPPFTPFKDWDVSNPTGSLPWYDAYNKTKHDREEELKLATLSNAVMAVGAVVVMFHAQFGLNFGTGVFDQKSPIIRNIFRIVTTGFKKYERAFYIPRMTLQAGTPPTPTPDWNWDLVNYPFA